METLKLLLYILPFIVGGSCKKSSDAFFVLEEANLNTSLAFVNIYWMELAGFIFLVVGSISYIYIRREKRQKQLQGENNKKIELHLQEKELTIAGLQNQLISEQRKNSEIETRLKHTLDLLEMSLFKFSTDKPDDLSKARELFYTTSLYQGIESEWTKMTTKNWQDLIDKIDNLLYIDFTYRLKKLYPGITELELHLCCLVKLKIPVGRISTLLCVTSQGISISRKRLYTKLTGKVGSAKELDKFIAEF